MTRVNILLLIIFLFKLTVAVNLLNTTKDTGNCFSKKCIYKCCPIGEYPRKKICTKKDARVDFNGLIVYDVNMQDTGRKVQDEFTILSGKLKNDSVFQSKAFVSSLVGYIPYIMDSGVLTLEMRNDWPRWVHVPSNNFCVDYLITKRGDLTAKPKFMISESPGVMSPHGHKTSIILIAGLLVSCVFLLLVLVVYILLPELQNLGGLILMSYVTSLFTALMTQAVSLLGTFTLSSCLAFTFVSNFSFLASCCWMSVMSYDIWWTFRGYARTRPIHRRGERFKFLMYCVFAWGVPLLMSIFVVVVAVTDMKRTPWFITPQIPKRGCFLSGAAQVLYLYVPMLILIVCNWIFYLMTAFNIRRLRRGTAVLDTAATGTPYAYRHKTHRFMVYAKLSVVMGLNYAFVVISHMCTNFSYVWYVTGLYSVFLNIAIFVIFVCKRKIYRKLYKRYISSKQTTVELRVYPRGSSYTASML